MLFEPDATDRASIRDHWAAIQRIVANRPDLTEAEPDWAVVDVMHIADHCHHLLVLTARRQGRHQEK